jgi:hypothetical protein
MSTREFLGGLDVMAECKVLLLPGIELHLFRTQTVIGQTNTIRTLFSKYYTWPSFDLHTLSCHRLHVYHWREGQLFSDGDKMTAGLVVILLHDSHLTFSTAVYKHTFRLHTRTLCVSYRVYCYNCHKQRLYPYTTLTYWSVKGTGLCSLWDMNWILKYYSN